MVALIIIIIIGMISDFYLFKSDSGDKYYHGIKIINWIMVGSFIFMTIPLLFQILYFVFNQKRVGKKIFALHTSDYKTRIRLLMFDLAIIVFEIILFIISPSINGLFSIGIVVILALNSMTTFYFMNGLYNGGLMYAGNFNCWKDVITYYWNSDKLLIFKVKNKRKEFVELKYFIKQNNCNEIQSYLQQSLDIKSDL
jgi:hypothetical protein